MNPEDAVDFGREAVMTCLTLTAPILIVGVVVAIAIGVIQSMTQVQDQAVSFIPKIILVALTFVLCLPWLTDRMIEYSRDLLEKPKLVLTHIRADESFSSAAVTESVPGNPRSVDSFQSKNK